MVEHTLTKETIKKEISNLIKTKNQIETLLGPLTHLEKLGEGGNAIVYSSKWGKQDVAVKILAEPLKEKKSTTYNRFINEFKSLILLPPNDRVIKVYHVELLTLEEITLPFFIMEKCKMTLDDWWKENPVHSFEDFFPLFRQLVRAIHFIHSNNIIHRDLKPKNILINQENKLLLADFGIAWFDPDFYDHMAKTKPGDRLNNYKYSAPEQIDRNVKAHTTMDLWALGQIIQEMVTGKTHQGVIRKKLVDIHSSFHNLDPIIDLLLKQNPIERLQTTTELWDLILNNRNDITEVLNIPYYLENISFLQSGSYFLENKISNMLKRQIWDTDQYYIDKISKLLNIPITCGYVTVNLESATFLLSQRVKFYLDIHWYSWLSSAEIYLCTKGLYIEVERKLADDLQDFAKKHFNAIIRLTGKDYKPTIKKLEMNISGQDLPIKGIRISKPMKIQKIDKTVTSLIFNKNIIMIFEDNNIIQLNIPDLNLVNDYFLPSDKQYNFKLLGTQYLFCFDEESSESLIYDLKTQEIKTLNMVKEYFIDGSFSLDGYFIALITNSDYFKIYEIANMKLITQIDERKFLSYKKTTCATISSDNKIIAIGENNKKVKLRKIPSGEVIYEFSLLSKPNILKFSPDNTMLIAVCSKNISTYNIIERQIEEFKIDDLISNETIIDVSFSMKNNKAVISATNFNINGKSNNRHLLVDFSTKETSGFFYHSHETDPPRFFTFLWPYFTCIYDKEIVLWNMEEIGN